MTKPAEETTRHYAHKAAMQKKMPALPIEVRGVSAQGHPRLKPNLSYSFCSFCFFFFVFVFFSTPQDPSHMQATNAATMV